MLRQHPGLQLQRLGQVRQATARRAQGFQGLAIAALAQVELAQRADGVEFGGVAAPAIAKPVIDPGRLHRGDGPVVELDASGVQQGRGGDGVDVALGDRLEHGQGPGLLALRLEDSRLHQAGVELFDRVDCDAEGGLDRRFGDGVLLQLQGRLGVGAGALGTGIHWLQRASWALTQSHAMRRDEVTSSTPAARSAPLAIIMASMSWS